MEHSIALVTGTTSGLGYAAASMLAAEGCRQVIVTGRSLARVQETAAQLAAETKTQVFTPLELDLNAPASVQAALASLVKRERPIDFLLLNAGLVPTKKRVITAAGVEASQAPLIGHHQLTVGLLRANLLSPNARIVIAGAAACPRGRTHVQVHRPASTSRPNTTGATKPRLLKPCCATQAEREVHVPNNAYADAKLIIAWWTASAAGPPASRRHGRVRRIARWGDRHQGGAKRWPVVEVSVYPDREPHSRHESDAGDRHPARRYLQASEFGTDVSGQFFASAQGKFSGPIEAQRHPHLLDRASQEAAWQAVVKVSGVDLSYPASSAVS